MSTDSAAEADEGNVAGHFQLAPETFGDADRPTPRQPAPAAAGTQDDDDADGHDTSTV